MLFDVQFDGHVVVEADTRAEAALAAQRILDRSGTYACADAESITVYET